MENLKVVDIFIGTTLRGSAKGSGRAMYIMRTKRKNGSDYEAAPQIVEYDNTTESESVLRAIRDALQRLHYACTVVIHTECSNVAAAITQHWPEKWQRDGWKSAKGNHGEECCPMGNASPGRRGWRTYPAGGRRET